MELPPLTRGRILRRYKRFLADLELDDGSRVTAHVPNTGAMTACWRPGARAQLSHSDNPRRKLAWTLERVDMGAGWVGVHTGRANPVVAEGIAAGLVPGLAGYRTMRREVAFAPPGHPPGRLDIGLYEGPGADALVEVKNVTLLDGQCLRFPDAVSKRAHKHLGLLLAAVEEGRRGIVLFALNRPEGDLFAPAWGVDPAYCERLKQVVAAGVEPLAVRIRHSTQGMDLGECLPIRL